MSILTIARLTFREAARRKILLAALVMGLAFLVIFGLGFHFIIADFERFPGNRSMLERTEISNFLLMAGLYVVNFLTIMMAVLTSVDTVSGEIATGTVQTMVAKPVHRWEVIVGKWLGFGGMISLYLLLMAGGVIGLIYFRIGYLANFSLGALLLLDLNALVLLSLSLLGGTRLSTLANGVLVFGLFGIAFIGGWIEQIGTFMSNTAAQETSKNIGVITSLLLPSEAIWKRASFELSSPLVRSLGMSPFTSTSVPSDLMMAYSGLYMLACLGLAVWYFSKRDL